MIALCLPIENICMLTGEREESRPSWKNEAAGNESLHLQFEWGWTAQCISITATFALDSIRSSWCPQVSPELRCHLTPRRGSCRSSWEQYHPAAWWSQCSWVLHMWIYTQESCDQSSHLLLEWAVLKSLAARYASGSWATKEMLEKRHTNNSTLSCFGTVKSAIGCIPILCSLSPQTSPCWIHIWCILMKVSSAALKENVQKIHTRLQMPGKKVCGNKRLTLKLRKACPSVLNQSPAKALHALLIRHHHQDRVVCDLDLQVT